jgi:hypothetical protein
VRVVLPASGATSYDYGRIDMDQELSDLLASEDYGTGSPPPDAPTQGREPSSPPQQETNAGGRATPINYADEWEQEVSLAGEERPAPDTETTGEPGDLDGIDLDSFGLDPAVAAQIRALFAGQAATPTTPPPPLERSDSFGDPRARQPLPPPPEPPDILNQQVYDLQRQRVANNYLPAFQQAEQAGDMQTARAVAMRYEADIVKLDAYRERVGMMYQAYQLAGRHEQLLTVANAQQREKKADELAKRYPGVSRDDLLVHPVTKQEIWDQSVMEATAAALALVQHRQARAARGRADQPIQTTQGGDQADDSQRLARMNPFSREYDALLKHVMAGHTVDPRRLPRRSRTS